MWFKVDDKLHDHPKIQRLLERGDGEALSLWLLAGSWSGDQMSDGLVSGFVLGRWHPDWRRLAEALVEVDLWDSVDVEGRPHFRFHDWTDYNDAKDTILRDREHHAMRVALQRDIELITKIKKRDRDRCRYCGTLVNWRARRGPAAATYDHVRPLTEGGRNTFENVVVACKGCNDRKNRRTVREAGMRLLTPGSPGAPVPDEDAPASAAYQVRAQHELSTPAGAERSTPGSGRVGSGAQNVPSTDLDTQHASDHAHRPDHETTPAGAR